MTEYVVGFLFNPSFTQVALIRKNKPAWQAGKLNGVGGKIEEGETAYDAMRREFREETGATVNDWRLSLILDFENARLWVFHDIAEDLSVLRTTTDEVVEVHNVDTVHHENTIPNVPWLVHLSLSFSKGERAEHFVMREVYADCEAVLV